MSRPGQALRARGWELALEAVMVVFAVLVALAVDEWRQEGELEARVERARSAVLAELTSNRDELRVGMASVDAMYEGVIEMLDRLDAGEALTQGSLGAELPDFSDAAWETARVTGVVAYMDYALVLQTARVYETQDQTVDLQNLVILSVGRLTARGFDRDVLTDLKGQLFIVRQMYANLDKKYAEILPAQPSTDSAR